MIENQISGAEVHEQGKPDADLAAKEDLVKCVLSEEEPIVNYKWPKA